jgi:hypothetical protein
MTTARNDHSKGRPQQGTTTVRDDRNTGMIATQGRPQRLDGHNTGMTATQGRLQHKDYHNTEAIIALRRAQHRDDQSIGPFKSTGTSTTQKNTTAKSRSYHRGNQSSGSIPQYKDDPSIGATAQIPPSTGTAIAKGPSQHSWRSICRCSA